MVFLNTSRDEQEMNVNEFTEWTVTEFPSWSSRADNWRLRCSQGKNNVMSCTAAVQALYSMAAST